MADVRLLDFTVKTTPVPADIVYLGNSASAFDEVKSTIAEIIAAYPALASIAGLTTAANKMIYATASNVYATTDLTAYARTLLDDADAATARTTLGLGTLATQSGTFSGTSSGTNTGDQNLFGVFAVAGQSNVVADTTNDTLTVVAGTNVTITTDAAADSITINAADSVTSAATTATTDDTTTNATMYPVWKTASTGNLAEYVCSTKLTFNPSTGMFSATGFTGAFIGNVTGNVSGSSGSCTGNAATVTTNANLTGVVTSTGNATIFATMSTNYVLLGNGTATPQQVAPGASGSSLMSNGTTWAAGGAYVVETTTSRTMTAFQPVIANNAGLVTLTIPATTAVGDVFEVVGLGAGLWKVQANTGQIVNFGSGATSSAGSITATNRYDSLKFVCVVANTTFVVTPNVGNMTIA